MTTLNDFLHVDDNDDVMAIDINELHAASLLAKYSNSETLSGTRTLLDVDTPIQRFNCDGANRIVQMPTADTEDNHPYLLVNATASGTYTLTVQNNGGTETHAVLNPGESVLMLPDGNGTYTARISRSFSRVVSPSQITSDQNDYNPSSAPSADVLRLSTDTSRNITGLGFPAGGKQVILVNAGSYDIVLKDESASSTAANRFALSADVTIEPDQAVMAWYDATSSRWRVIGGTGSGSASGGLTNNIASVTTSNVTGVAGTRHILDVSGMTANRNFVLPAGAVDDEIEVNISTGDDTYALILIGDTGITINGGSAATEWSRLFISGETVRFVATSTSNWQVISDKRIPCIGILERQTAQSIASGGSGTKIQLATAVKNQGGIADTTNYRINIRRAGTYNITGIVVMANVMDDQENVQSLVYVDGALDRYQITYVSDATTNRPGMASLSYPKELAVNKYIELYAYHNEGASQDTNTSYFPLLAVVEII